MEKIAAECTQETVSHIGASQRRPGLSDKPSAEDQSYLRSFLSLMQKSLHHAAKLVRTLDIPYLAQSESTHLSRYDAWRPDNF